MIKKAIGLFVRSPLLKTSLYPFSQKLPIIDVKSQEEHLQLMDWRELMQAQRRNVMKNYDTLLPGIYVRNEMMMDAEQIWEVRSKRHRHAKLKRNRRKGPRRTVITN